MQEAKVEDFAGIIPENVIKSLKNYLDNMNTKK